MRKDEKGLLCECVRVCVNAQEESEARFVDGAKALAVEVVKGERKGVWGDKRGG
jgi:hypothetical protein